MNISCINYKLTNMLFAARIFMGVCFIFLTCSFLVLASVCYCRAKEQLNEQIHPEVSNVKSESDSGAADLGTSLSDSDNPILNV